MNYRLVDTFCFPASKNHTFLENDEVEIKAKSIQKYNFPVYYVRKPNIKFLDWREYAVVEVWGQV